MSKHILFTGAAQVVGITDNQLPSRIELMPTGELHLDDERGHVGQISDAAGLIQRSMSAAKGGMLAIDFEHGMDRNGGDGRAAGWIAGLSLEGDRIMADVEWTAAGEEALRGKIYRFISPTFTVSAGTREAGLILRAGLTNDPAFRELAQVASTQEKDTMPQWLKKLAAKVGMPDETDETKIMAAAEAALDQVEHATSIVTAAGLTGPLTATAATAIATKITAAANPGEPDPAKYAPISVVSALQQDLATLTAQVQGSTAEQLVTAAMQSGKLQPALKDWGLQLATSNPDAFKTFIASATPIVDGGRVTPQGDPLKVDQGVLTASEKIMCSKMGVTEEAFLATKQGTPQPAAKKDA